MKKNVNGELSWPYENVSRTQFEERKGFAEKVLVEYGAVSVDIDIAYKNTTTSIVSGYNYTSAQGTSVYKFRNCYYRVDEVLFPDRPFIVFEVSDSIEDVRKNVMEDVNPFPYNLTDDEIRNAIRNMLLLDI